MRRIEILTRELLVHLLHVSSCELLEAPLLLSGLGGSGAGTGDPDEVAHHQGDGLLDEALSVSLEELLVLLHQLGVGAPLYRGCEKKKVNCVYTQKFLCGKETTLT